MHLVRRPDWLDRVDRALWRIPGLRLFLFFSLVKFCFDQTLYVLSAALVVAGAWMVLDEFLPRLRKEKPAPE